jgi:hypothetical protein
MASLKQTISYRRCALANAVALTRIFFCHPNRVDSALLVQYDSINEHLFDVRVDNASLRSRYAAVVTKIERGYVHVCYDHDNDTDMIPVGSPDCICDPT